MGAYANRMLLMQGYGREEVALNQNLNLLARWTPFACGCFGAIGLVVASPLYMWGLGALTLLGSASPRSFYDYLYQMFLRPVTGLGGMPRHGAPRRFGCAIGAALFALSGTGFHLHNPMLALVPALIIIPLAFIAAVTQWCFASALFRFLFRRGEPCC